MKDNNPLLDGLATEKGPRDAAQERGQGNSNKSLEEACAAEQHLALGPEESVKGSSQGE